MSKLRLIQCGAGGWGRTWSHDIVPASEDFELVALVDVADAPLDDAKTTLNFPVDRCFTSLADALGSVQADAVLTVTPPAVHVEHAELAFARGLHLLTEKPISTDLAGAKRMVELARRADRRLVVSQNYRYSPVMQKLRAVLRDQIAGEFGHGQVDFYIPADFTGTFRGTMQFPLLIDMAIHHVDLIRALTGRNITRVTAQTFNPTWSWFAHHAALKMLLELEGSVHFSYSGDWSGKGRCTPWNGNWRFQCADGSIHLEDDKLLVARCEKWMKDPTSQPIDVPEPALKGQHVVLHNFANAIRTGVEAETSGQDNLWSFAAVMAAVQSASEGGRPVDVTVE